MRCEGALLRLIGNDNRNVIAETVAIVRLVYSSEEIARRRIAAVKDVA